MPNIRPYLLAAMNDDGRGGAESRFRDRDGREHYDDGRFAPMRGAYGDYNEFEDRGGRRGRPSMGGAYGPYDAFQARGGRFRGRNGGNMQMFDGGSSYWDAGYPMTPPVYREDMEMDSDAMGRIGFSVDGEVGRPWEMGGYRADGPRLAGGEMDPHRRRQFDGYAAGGDRQPLTREAAESWVAGMKNADGSTGAHWTMEQTKQVQAQKGIGLDPVKFWVAMNMMFSDYATAAEKAGVSTTDFYADLAKAFLVDKDAVPDKLDRYYCAIVKR